MPVRIENKLSSKAKVHSCSSPHFSQHTEDFFFDSLNMQIFVKQLDGAMRTLQVTPFHSIELVKSLVPEIST